MMKLLYLTIIAACAMAFGHGPDDKSDSADATLHQKAAELAQKFIIVDGHVDVPYRMIEKQEDISVKTEGGDFDFERARAGGLSAPIMSIYVPASYEKGGAKDFADSLIDMVEDFQKNWPDKFAIAHSAWSAVEAHAASH